MARSKQQSGKDGKHRKETKEERRIRLEKQQEARQACFKLLPWAGGFLLIAMIAFSWYVRSVPPKQIIQLPMASNQRLDPEFLQRMNQPIQKEEEKSSESENTETIEL